MNQEFCPRKKRSQHMSKPKRLASIACWCCYHYSLMLVVSRLSHLHWLYRCSFVDHFRCCCCCCCCVCFSCVFVVLVGTGPFCCGPCCCCFCCLGRCSVVPSVAALLLLVLLAPFLLMCGSCAFVDRDGTGPWSREDLFEMIVAKSDPGIAGEYCT